MLEVLLGAFNGDDDDDEEDDEDEVDDDDNDELCPTCLLSVVVFGDCSTGDLTFLE